MDENVKLTKHDIVFYGRTGYEKMAILSYLYGFLGADNVAFVSTNSDMVNTLSRPEGVEWREFVGDSLPDWITIRCTNDEWNNIKFHLDLIPAFVC